MIDVIIPVYNGGRYLREAVESALRQTLPPDSIIIVDDGSTDETPSLARSLVSEHHGRVRYLRTVHRGVSAARNRGISASQATLLAFLDADDRWLPDKLARQVAILSGSDAVGLVHSSYELIDAHGAVLLDGRVVAPQLRGDLLHPLLFDEYVLSGSASSAVVRRDVLDRVGYFDVSLSYGEDWDLWLRIAAASLIDYSPEVLVQIRVHADSAQRRDEPGKFVDFALQRSRVYSKWADVVPEFASRIPQMQGQVASTLLAEIRRPWELERYYRCAAAQGDALFGSRRDLWRAVIRRGLQLGLPLVFMRRLVRDLGRRP